MSNHRESKRGTQKGSSGGNRRNIQIGPLVRMAQGAVLDGFRNLPPWARRECAASLCSLFPGEFGGTPPAQEVPKPGPAQNVRAPTPTAVATGEKEGKGNSKPAEIVGILKGTPTKKAPSLKGFNRPEVKDLDCAKMMREASSTQRQSDEMREVQKLLSAALGASARGHGAGASTSEIAKALAESKHSTKSFARLWPSLRTRKEWAAKAAPSHGKLRPEVRSVDDKYIIHTPLVPRMTVKSAADLEEDEDFFLNRALPLANISFHFPAADGVIPHLDRALVQKFLGGRTDDYSNLAPYIHLLDGRVHLFWVGFDLTGLRWGDDDSDIAVVEATTPKKKKRKISQTTGD